MLCDLKYNVYFVQFFLNLIKDIKKVDVKNITKRKIFELL